MIIPKDKKFALLTVCGLAIYAVCAGFRDTYGILLPYLAAASRQSYFSLSFIIAVGQFIFGIMQPVFGYLAVKSSARFVLLTGCAFMLAGLAAMPYASGFVSLLLALGIVLPAGTAGAAFGLIVSCLSAWLPEKETRISSGFVASGIGISICVLSPILQHFAAKGSVIATSIFLSTLVLMIIPAIYCLTKKPLAEHKIKSCQHNAHRQPQTAPAIRRSILAALSNSAYLRITFAFITCGFHMSLIQTHLFSQLQYNGIPAHFAAYGISIYGIGVIAGTWTGGAMADRFSITKLLATIYLSRCFLIAPMLGEFPAWFIFVDIFFFGVTTISTLAPTAGIVNIIFGRVLLPTLFGITYFAHQVGAFLGSWAGGICYRYIDSYASVWIIDIGLCLAASLACFGIPRLTKFQPQ